MNDAATTHQIIDITDADLDELLGAPLTAAHDAYVYAPTKRGVYQSQQDIDDRKAIFAIERWLDEIGA